MAQANQPVKNQYCSFCEKRTQWYRGTTQYLKELENVTDVFYCGCCEMNYAGISQ